MEAVILVKFVLLVSVHTTSVNETGISDASKFNCFTGSGLHEEADPAIARLSRPCSPALASCLCGIGGIIVVFLILSVHSGKDSFVVSFPSMIRFSLTTAMRDVMDSKNRSMWGWWSAVELPQLC